jgi:XTP/dITP diphosphohydrolase
MRPDRLLLATGNAHKLREVAEILSPFGVEIDPPAAVGGLPDVIEDADTFAGNAIKKAQAGVAATGRWCLADDSGIEARALDGRPGVYSARFAGEPCDDAANNAKMCAELANQVDRYVQYRCVIALCRPDAEPLTWDGTLPGEWVMEPRGAGGFGYDPYVLQPDLGLTVAEMTAEAKHARSHRGAALRAFVHWWASSAD